MPIIRTIQSRDVQSLVDSFTHQDDDYFETMYLEHLQDKQVIFLAVEKDASRAYHYLGYVSVLWESAYTQFWRRNIPEISDLYVKTSYRNQGIAQALIAACEVTIRNKGHHKIGISVVQTKDYQAAQALYERLGYSSDGFGITDDNQAHLVKQLT